MYIEALIKYNIIAEVDFSFIIIWSSNLKVIQNLCSASLFRFLENVQLCNEKCSPGGIERSRISLNLILIETQRTLLVTHFYFCLRRFRIAFSGKAFNHLKGDVALIFP